MRHKPEKMRLARFYKYIQRVFSFQQLISQLNDHRMGANSQTESLFETLFCGLLLRLGSFGALAFEIKPPRILKVIPHRVQFCINTLRYGLAHFEREPLEETLLSITPKMKRSKMLADTIGTSFTLTSFAR